MNDPEETEVKPTPPPPPPGTGSLTVFGTAGEGAAPLSALGQFILFAMMPFVSFAAILLMNSNVMAAMMAAGMIAGFYWLAFLRLNPRMVGLALIPIILVPYYGWTERMPENGIYPTLWMAAAALAGGAGAWLTRHEAREDDMIFVPPAICALAFVVLVWLGTGAQSEQALQWAHEKLEAVPRDLVAQSRQSPALEGVITPESLAALSEITPLHLTVSLCVVWALGMWLFGRLARRIAGYAEGARSALILFRLTPRYIFLLIAGLGFGILGSLPGCGEWLYVAGPLLAVLAMAFAFEGLGVAIFFAALRRAGGDKAAGLMLMGVALLALLSFPEVLVLAGLLDHWFDFRRLNRIATLQAGS